MTYLLVHIGGVRIRQFPRALARERANISDC